VARLNSVRQGFGVLVYEDGNEAMAGDLVHIDVKYRGTVVACMDRNEYLRDQEQWAYLREGIMIDTDFAGLVHYGTDMAEGLVLVKRAANP
jgi:hypothetical protein